MRSSPPSLGLEVKKSHDNNFDVIRLLLAALVILCHSGRALNRSAVSIDPLDGVTLGQEDLGHVAVCGFFALSGCLVTASWLNSDGALSYFRKRVLRIYPGFIVAWLVCAFVVLPLSGVAWSEYVAMVRPGLWALKLALLRGFGGVTAFPGNPQQALNTSLWSIPVEFGCYILVAVLGFAKVLRSRPAAVAVTALVGVVVAAVPLLDFVQPASQAVASLRRPLALLATHITLPHFYFLLGMLAFLFRKELRLSGPLAIAATLTLLVAARVPPLLHVVTPFCWTYLLLYLAYLPRLRVPLVGPNLDLSYGLYLYGWPIQQLLVMWLEPSLSMWGLFALTLPLTAVAAYFSWTFVERPAQRLNHYFSRTPAPPAPPALPAEAEAQTVSTVSGLAKR